MENNNVKNSINISNETENNVWKFYSSVRTYMPNSIEPIGMLGALLYLCQNGLLQINYNVPTSQGNAIALMDSSYLNTFHNNMVELWDANGYNNMGLCSVLSTNDKMYSVISDYLNKINEISDIIYVFEIVEYLSKADLSSEEYLALFDYAIDHFGKNKDVPLYKQPAEMTKLAASLIDDDASSMFNPFSGLQSYALGIDSISRIKTVEINDTIWKFGMIRLALAKKDEKVSSVLGDVSNWPREQFDVIVATPPFRSKINMSDRHFFGAMELSDTVALRRFEATTTAKGQLFTFVPLSVLWSEAEADLRMDLVNKNYLDAVIQLPGSILPFTNIPVALIILKKGRRLGEKVKFVDASLLYTEVEKKRFLDVDSIMKAYSDMESVNNTIVSVSKIAEAEYSWDYRTYKVIMDESQIPDGFIVKRLNDFIAPANGQRYFNEVNGHLARVTELSGDVFNIKKSPMDFPLSDNLKNSQKITEPVLLISTIRDLKPTFCNASENEPIFINPNVAAFRVSTTEIDLGYLCLQLSKAAVITAGTAIPHITRKALMSIRIALPPYADDRSLEVQKQLYESAKREHLLAEAKNMGLMEYINEMKHNYIMDVRQRKHDMRPLLREIGSSERTIRYILQHINEFSGFEEKIENKLNVISQNLALLYEYVEHFSDEESFGEKELFNLDDYFYNELQDQERYIIDYDCDDDAFREYGMPVHEAYNQRIHDSSIEDIMNRDIPYEIAPIFAEICPRDFRRLVQNILDNALVHGFTDPERNDYGVQIDLSVDAERNMYQMDFRNNGQPLPKGLTKEIYGRRGATAGPTAGTGDGGNIIKRIVMHYGGDYDIFMDGEITNVRIYLPIPNN